MQTVNKKEAALFQTAPSVKVYTFVVLLLFEFRGNFVHHIQNFLTGKAFFFHFFQVLIYYGSRFFFPYLPICLGNIVYGNARFLT
jgi:hypothetical protein